MSSRPQRKAAKAANAALAATIAQDTDAVQVKKGRGKKVTVNEVTDDVETLKVDGADTGAQLNKDAVLTKKKRAKKLNPYGVTLGVTPYPEMARPTAKECQTVHDLLTKEHGDNKSRPPEDFPVPSRTVAGCGNVKYILEALIRTLMSGHTSQGNANRAWTGLSETFPRLQKGSCANFIDWDSIRRRPQAASDIEKAIQSGGMAPKKSLLIKALLDIAYEENEALREALRSPGKLSDEKVKVEDTNLDNKPANNTSGRSPTEVAEAIQKPLEVLQHALEHPEDKSKEALMARFCLDTLLNEPEVLTLDYVHAMSKEDAFYKMITFPGIGVKTAACVMLFSVKQPFLAVDTHVFRLSGWLGWVPENADRDTTFAHIDLRCPDELKYGLHQLMIEHGKKCRKCQANSGENSEGWDRPCVLEAMLNRTGARKGGVDPPKPKKRKAASKEEEDSDDKKAPAKAKKSKLTKTKARAKSGDAVSVNNKSPAASNAKGKNTASTSTRTSPKKKLPATERGSKVVASTKDKTASAKPVQEKVVPKNTRAKKAASKRK